MILKSTGFNKEKKFIVEKTNIIQDKSEVFKMNPNTFYNYMKEKYVTNVNE
jgi:hypothetical protein